MTATNTSKYIQDGNIIYYPNMRYNNLCILYGGIYRCVGEIRINGYGEKEVHFYGADMVKESLRELADFLENKI